MLIAVLQRKLCRKRAAKNFTGRLRGAFPINPRYIRSTAQQAARRRSLEFQERRIVRIRAPKGAQNMTLCIAAVKAARMRDLKAHVVTRRRANTGHSRIFVPKELYCMSATAS